jgi:AcrR family transcriptional regulator
VLTSVPCFDEHGIWRYNGIFFSRHGNITQTIIKLVNDSAEGMEVQRICEVLGVAASSLYTHFRTIKQLSSKRFGRTLVYFSAQQDIYNRQVAQRNAAANARTAPPTLAGHTDAILVLVDRIRHPDDTVEQCARRLHHVSPTITPQWVAALLREHDLQKKTPDTI